MKNSKYLLIGLLILIININFIFGLELSKDYYPGNPAIVAPGETKEIVFARISSPLSEGDKNVNLEMVNDSGIAKINSPLNFNVFGGGESSEVKLVVTINSNIPEDSLYEVVIKVKDTTISNGTGMVGFNKFTTSSIPILVKKTVAPQTEISPTKEFPIVSNIIWIVVVIILIIIIAIVAYILFKKK